MAPLIPKSPESLDHTELGQKILADLVMRIKERQAAPQAVLASIRRQRVTSGSGAVCPKCGQPMVGGCRRSCPACGYAEGC